MLDSLHQQVRTATTMLSQFSSTHSHFDSPKNDASPSYQVVHQQDSIDSRKLPLSIECSTRSVYRGLFGNVTTHKKLKHLSDCNNSRSRKKQVVRNERLFLINIFLLKRTIEIRLISSLGKVSRNLTSYPLMRSDAPVFWMCEEGDLKAIQSELDERNMSPFVVDEYGWTLLHVCILTTFIIGSR